MEWYCSYTLSFAVTFAKHFLIESALISHIILMVQEKNQVQASKAVVVVVVWEHKQDEASLEKQYLI